MTSSWPQSVRPFDKDGDQSTSGPGRLSTDHRADEARLAELRGAAEDDLGRDARENGATPARVGR